MRRIQTSCAHPRFLGVVLSSDDWAERNQARAEFGSYLGLYCPSLAAIMAERPRVSSPEVVAYLDELVEIGIYGRNSSAVATWIVRKEIMRLIEEGVLKPIPAKALAAAIAAQGA